MLHGYEIRLSITIYFNKFNHLSSTASRARDAFSCHYASFILSFFTSYFDVLFYVLCFFLRLSLTFPFWDYNLRFIYLMLFFRTSSSDCFSFIERMRRTRVSFSVWYFYFCVFPLAIAYYFTIVIVIKL